MSSTDLSQTISNWFIKDNSALYLIKLQELFGTNIDDWTCLASSFVTQKATTGSRVACLFAVFKKDVVDSYQAPTAKWWESNLTSCMALKEDSFWPDTWLIFSKGCFFYQRSAWYTSLVLSKLLPSLNVLHRAGMSKLRPATNFYGARESLKEIIKKFINVEERDWVHFSHWWTLKIKCACIFNWINYFDSFV